jgi:carboxylesterase type B
VGGISVAIHLVSPQSRGLFQQAIIESAVTSSLTNQSYVGAQGNTLVAALNCSTSSNAAIRAVRHSFLRSSFFILLLRSFSSYCLFPCSDLTIGLGH